MTKTIDVPGAGRSMVPAVAAGTVRPRWSVMIPVFNAAADLRRSLESVLAQDPGSDRMQIEVVDDCSTKDDPEAVVRAEGKGRAGFHRQARNVGHSANFNTCLRRSRGELVHILHADDWVGDGFYRKMEELFVAEPRMGAAVCRHAIMGADGTVQRISTLERSTPGLMENCLEKLAAGLPFQPPSIAVRRCVYEHLGGFETRMASCGEDWEMWVRIAVHYPIGFLPEVLAFYQDSPDSVTKRSVRTGQNIKDVRLACRITRGYLPPGPAQAANRQALENWAEWALYWAQQGFAAGDYRTGLVQMREALLCSRSPRILAQTARIGRFGLKRVLRGLRARAYV
jgi:glycosyltransferase involved in cell wall biosynthesis